MKLLERIKFRIAYYISGRYPKACGYNLFAWAMGLRTTKEVFWQGGWKDQDCTEKYGAYCGKCVKTGRLKW